MATAPLEYLCISYKPTPPLAWVTLSRPQQGNRVDLRLTQELQELAEHLEQTPEVRVLLVTGAGNPFSTGREPVPLSVRQAGGDAIAHWMRERRASTALAALPIPVVAVINGDAVDQGLELALACDLRIASSGAQLGFTDISRGIVPWDGATQRLPRLIGSSRALDMLLTSRLVSASEALDIGLVNAVAAPHVLLQEAQHLAGMIATGAPIASRYAKEAVLAGFDMPLEQGLRLEADLNILLHTTEDRAEGIRSFLAKTVPQYRGE